MDVWLGKSSAGNLGGRTYWVSFGKKHVTEINKHDTWLNSGFCPDKESMRKRRSNRLEISLSPREARHLADDILDMLNGIKESMVSEINEPEK